MNRALAGVNIQRGFPILDPCRAEAPVRARIEEASDHE